jgi:hypothetical protein
VTGGGSFEAVLVGSPVERQSIHEKQEMALEIKNAKENPGRTSIKNHPRPKAPAEDSVPVRRHPPWFSKAALGPRSRVKNHPRECKD